MTSSPIHAFTAVLAASAAKAGIFGNNAEESVYPMTRWLTDGEVLDGSKHNYTLTFPARQMPPAVQKVN
jgi:hypothetical protein